MDLLRLPFEHSTDYQHVRYQVRTVLAAGRDCLLVDDAVLVATELVENVIQHTGDGGELLLSRRGDMVRRSLRLQPAGTTRAATG